MEEFEINQWLLNFLALDPQRSLEQQEFNHNLLSLADWQAILDKAIEQQVASLLYFQLRHLPEIQIPSTIHERLSALYRKNTFFNMALMHELQTILQQLNAHDIPAIILKGAYLAKDIYPKIGIREMVDIDLLVPYEKVQQAAKCLEKLGYKSIRSHSLPLEVEAEMTHQLPPFRKSFTLPVVEIHWTICNPTETYQFDIKECWERAKTIDVFGEMALCFAPEDLILNLCHHASYHHYFNAGIRSLYDLALVIEYFKEELNWEFLKSTAERWHWQKGTYLMLALTLKCFNISLPEKLLKEIQLYEIDDQILAIAEAELLNNRSVSKSITLPLATFIDQPNLFEKMKLIGQRILISPQLMTRIYPLKPSDNFFKLSFYYVIRIRDLWRRHSKRLQKLSAADSRMIISVSQRKEFLKAFLSS